LGSGPDPHPGVWVGIPGPRSSWPHYGRGLSAPQSESAFQPNAYLVHHGFQQGTETVLSPPQVMAGLLVQKWDWLQVLTPKQAEQIVSRVPLQRPGHGNGSAR